MRAPWRGHGAALGDELDGLVVVEESLFPIAVPPAGPVRKPMSSATADIVKLVQVGA